MEQTEWIYALADPRLPSKIRYVGRTGKTLSKRLKNHINEAHRRLNRKNNWIWHIRSEGVSPIVWPIERCLAIDAVRRESYWINFFKPLGWLTNSEWRRVGPMVGKRYTKSERTEVVLRKMRLLSRGKRGPLSDIGYRELMEKRRKSRGRFRSDKHKSQFLRMLSTRKPPLISEAERRRRSDAAKARKGKPISKAHMEQVMSIGGWNRRSVQCVETGEVFRSVSEAGRSVGIISSGKIQLAIARNGTCGKKHWRFL